MSAKNNFKIASKEDHQYDVVNHTTSVENNTSFLANSRRSLYPKKHTEDIKMIGSPG